MLNDKNKNKREKGAALFIVVIFFLAISMVMVFGLATPIISEMKMARDFLYSKESYFAAESGAEDAYFRIKNNMSFSSPETLVVGPASTVTEVTIIGSNEKEITSVGDSENHVRKVSREITVTDGFSFNYGVQVGLGGLDMDDNSTIVGNVYSDGPIHGKSYNANTVSGDAVSSGSSGYISSIRIVSNAYAHTIQNSRVGKDAHYTTLTNTTVLGNTFPNSADQPEGSMPISDLTLDEWGANAESGGVINSPCPYIITATKTIGPVKINCDLEIYGNSIVTLAGSVLVNGNIHIYGNSQIKVSNSVGNKSVTMIAYKSSNLSGGGTITVGNNALFYGSQSGGTTNPDSYILLVSRNNSAESGGSVVAVTVDGNAAGRLLLYAPHGEINISNNVILREVTAYKLSLENNTQVQYSIGLAQPIFVAGPGGKWKIRRWREAK